MNKNLAAQFLSAIITRNSGQRVEDDVKEALAYAEAFERLTATYTTPPAALELVQNPPFKLSRAKEWSVRFNSTFADFYTQDFRNDLLRSFLNSYAKCEKVTFLVAANNGILSTWEDKERILGFYGEEKDILVLSCFTETEVKQKIDAYYEERGGFAKHVEYLKSIGQW
jgi:hypothetical protein